jgi:hypothetical protein
VVSLLLRRSKVLATGIGFPKAEHDVRCWLKGGDGILKLRGVLKKLIARNLATNLILSVDRRAPQ